MKSVAFCTLGCKVNQYETEAMTEMFVKKGFVIKDFNEAASVYVINTCSVTNMGERKSRQMVRKAIGRNPDAVVAVVGCYSQTAGSEVSKIPGVDIVLGTRDRNLLPGYVSELLEKKDRQIVHIADIMEQVDFEDMHIEKMSEKVRAFMKIQDGCENFCTYCIIPFARGPVRSRNTADVLSEARRLAANGFSEIVLTGIHLASYGKDLQETDLAELLVMLDRVDGIKRIRLGSIEPGTLTERFIDCIAGCGKLCPHFHVSLQSGCDKTLQAMGRKYDTQEYSSRIKALRVKIPDAALSTDIMVGFPGETEEDFEASLDFAESIGFSKVHVFRYSPRKGTKAALMKNQIPEGVKEYRSGRMQALSDRMAEEYIVSFKDKKVEVLVEKQGKTYARGHTPHYINVKMTGARARPGETVIAQINGYEHGAASGRIVMD